MATKRLNTRIQNKMDSEANWNNNPDFIPLKGEMIVYSKDANNKAARVKIGDGVTKVTELPFFVEDEIFKQVSSVLITEV